MNALRSTLFLFIDSSQFTPVYPESPVAGPSGLSTCGRSDECVPCQETSGQKKQSKNTRFADAFLLICESCLVILIFLTEHSGSFFFSKKYYKLFA